MTKHYDLARGSTFIEPVPDALMEFIGAGAPSLSLNLLNSTTVQVNAGTDNDQQAVAINGKWRYRSTATTAAVPGATGAGTLSVFATGTANNIVAGGPAAASVDSTDYTFGIQILAGASVPSTALYRKVAEVDWDGAAITHLRHTIQGRPGDAHLSPTALLPTTTPLKVRAAASQTAPLVTVANSAGTILFSVASDGAVVSASTGAFSGALTAPSATISGSITSTGILTLNVAQEALRLRSGAAGTYSSLSLGRTTNELYFAVAGSASNYLTDVVAGDAVGALSDSTKTIRLGVGVGASQLRIANAGITIPGTLAVTGTTTAGALNSGALTASTGVFSGNVTADSHVSNTGTGAFVQRSATAGSTVVFATRAAASSVDSFSVQAGGTLSWGSGAGAVDATLVRAGAASMSLTGALTVSAGVTAVGTISGGTVVSTGTLSSSGNVAFNNKGPAAPPDYTTSNVTTDRILNADATTLDEVADVLGTLINDLINIGLLT